MKSKLIVKGGHSIDFTGCEVKVPGYPVDGLTGQVTKLLLNSL
jgi:hypothetical protein